jgi:DNA modification methylase
MVEHFLGNRVALHVGDCRDVLARLDENSIDACCCDPPYHLTSIVKRFGNEEPKKWEAIGNGHGGGVSPYHRTSKGFMGKLWDGGDIAFDPETWRLIYRVLKPGAHLLAMGGTRTYHRLACAIEDAGFEIRDCIQWLYGSGFPKSHDVSKGIDKAAGEQRDRIRGVRSGVVQSVYAQDAWSKEFKDSVLSSEPITDAARQWEGWGTALKPAVEMIVLARKPLSEGTVAANVLRWGTGAINVDRCRIGVDDGSRIRPPSKPSAQTFAQDAWTQNPDNRKPFDPQGLGRWPANVIHDGSEEVVAAFPDTETHAKTQSGYEHHGQIYSPRSDDGGAIYSGDSGSAARFFYTARPDEPSANRRYTDEGATNFAALPGARRDAVAPSRFFYTAKADSDDRLGSKHPTVKPLDLMQYLVRLITPPKGTCFDPFAGTGTTGEAAWREGMSAVLIEREEEYCADIRRRMALALAGPDERRFQAMKERLNGKPMDAGPLFSGHHFDDEPETAEVEPEALLPPAPKRDDGPLFEWTP